MNVLQQYKESLKVIEAEEIFDLLIYRPVAFLFVKATYNTNITPNQVSSAAMLFGVISGVLFGYGSYNYLIAGGILYFTCNVLDCADGQIARLKKNGTKTGRIIDGFIDYVVSTAVFIGIGIGLSIFTDNLLYTWMLTVLAGISSAVQAFCFDLYRNKFLENVYGKVSSLENEIREFEEERERIRNLRGKNLDKFLIAIYLVYTKLQLKLQPAKKSSPLPPSKGEGNSTQEYYKKNKLLLQLWSFAGSTTHITVCIFCAFINKLELYLIVCLIPMNLFIGILYLLQRTVGTKG
jgi:phosphatidylglycerophosphate synthase